MNKAVAASVKLNCMIVPHLVLQKQVSEAKDH